MIVLFTDFGPTGPYTGQMERVLACEAPGIPVIRLMCDAPSHRPRASAYLLAALAPEFPREAVFLCVVDPGVGSAGRRPVTVTVDGRRFVGPDNGLFEVVAMRGASARWREITWRPARLSETFHGRDLFAPAAAALARGDRVADRALARGAPARAQWPEDLAEIVYVDHFGNAMTGLRAGRLPAAAVLAAGRRELRRARTFSDVPPGQPLWYANSVGLAEIAVNSGSAAETFGLAVGDPVRVL